MDKYKMSEIRYIFLLRAFTKADERINITVFSKQLGILMFLKSDREYSKNESKTFSACKTPFPCNC